ncbi:MAG: dockerin type I domain-containing protein [Candidatus Zixiibacteriota bacterium]
METFHLFSLLSFRDLWFNTRCRNKSGKRWVIGHSAVIILALVLFLPVLTQAQQDTLILLGINNDLNYARGVSANGEYAFVADWDSGISVISYAVPNLPTTIIKYQDQSVMDIEINRDLAYYVGLGAFYVRDISNPLQSNIVGWCTGDNWDYWGIKVHVYDTLALIMHKTGYEATYSKIISISDPSNPQVLSTLSPPPYGTLSWGDIFKRDNYAFWVDKGTRFEPTWQDLGRIIVFDITDPMQPVPLSVDTCLPSYPNAIWIKDNYAYVALSNYRVDQGGLMILDVSDPYNIDSVGFFEIVGGDAWNVYIRGNYAYVCVHLKPALPSDRVYVLDISDPTNPALVTTYDTPGRPRDISVVDPYVLVAEDTSLLVFRAGFLRTPGDVNKDGQVDIGDIIFLINYLFKNSIAPEPIESGDVNGDCAVDIGDVVFLINYLFKNGPVPQDGC